VCANSDLVGSRSQLQAHGRAARSFHPPPRLRNPRSKLERVPSLLRDIIESNKLIRFDRAHFQEIGKSALNFEIVYFVLSADYNTYMDIHQTIIFDIFRTFRREGIDFAHPPRALYIPRFEEAYHAPLALPERPHLRASAAGG
jgi:MscS family membrane protein